MPPSKDKDEVQEKILKALQDLYFAQNEVFNELCKLKETTDINTHALIALNKWFQHLQDFEKQVFKHWLKDDGNPKQPPSNYPFGI